MNCIVRRIEDAPPDEVRFAFTDDGTLIEVWSDSGQWWTGPFAPRTIQPEYCLVIPTDPEAYIKECESASKERDALQARVTLLEEALRPLAECDYVGDLRGSDVRRAREVLAPAALSEQGDTANGSNQN